MIAPKEFTPAVRALIVARSGGVCEACGKARATQVHHRLYKSRGGRGMVQNGLHVCGLGGADGCHLIAHTAVGLARGWSVSSGDDPAEVAVTFPDGSRWLLMADGTRKAVK